MADTDRPHPHGEGHDGFGNDYSFHEEMGSFLGEPPVIHKAEGFLEYLQEKRRRQAADAERSPLDVSGSGATTENDPPSPRESETRG